MENLCWKHKTKCEHTKNLHLSLFKFMLLNWKQCTLMNNHFLLYEVAMMIYNRAENWYRNHIVLYSVNSSFTTATLVCITRCLFEIFCFCQSDVSETLIFAEPAIGNPLFCKSSDSETPCFLLEKSQKYLTTLDTSEKRHFVK